MQKTNKAPARGLLCSWRPQAPSRWGEGAERLLERVLEARARKWTQRASVLQEISLKKREGERERDRDQSSDGAKVFYSTLCELQLFSAEIKSKLTSYQGNLRSSIWKRVVNNHFYHVVDKKEEGTYHLIEKLTKEMPGFLSPQERLASLLNSWVFRN